MDEARVEALGAKPIAPELDAIRAAKTREALGALMGRTVRDFEGSAFNLGIDVDVKDTSHYAVYLGQGGLGLPDRDYYLAAVLRREEGGLAGLCREAAGAGGLARPRRATPPPSSRWRPRSPRRAGPAPSSATPTPPTTPTPWPSSRRPRPASLGAASSPKPDWARRPRSSWSRRPPSRRSPPSSRRRRWTCCRPGWPSASPTTPRPTSPSPSPTPPSRCARRAFPARPSSRRAGSAACMRSSGGDYGAGDRFDRFGNLGWAVGELYTAKYFPPAAKAKVQALVADLKSAYAARIEKLDWMSPATKAEALKKLAAYNVKVGYPDTTARLLRASWSATTTLWATSAAPPRPTGPSTPGARRARSTARTGCMTPQTNDAYNGSLHRHRLPGRHPAAADLRRRRRPGDQLRRGGRGDRPRADPRLRRPGPQVSTPQGPLRDWWAPADAKTFEARAKVFGAQYSPIEPRARRARERRPDHGREHRRPRRPDARPRRLPRLA